MVCSLDLAPGANITVVILVARGREGRLKYCKSCFQLAWSGTMDTQVNANLFHGARLTDLRRLLECVQLCGKRGCDFKRQAAHQPFVVSLCASESIKGGPRDAWVEGGCTDLCLKI